MDNQDRIITESNQFAWASVIHGDFSAQHVDNGESFISVYENLALGFKVVMEAGESNHWEFVSALSSRQVERIRALGAVL